MPTAGPITAPTVAPPFDRTRSRWLTALAVIAPIGPLAVGATRAVLPYTESDTATGVATAAAAHPLLMSAVLWFELLMGATLMVGVGVTAVAGVRAAPVWGGFGAVLAAVGFGVMLPAVAPPDLIAEAAARASVEPAATARVLEALAAYPASTAALALFVVGHVVGLMLLGVALWKGRAVPAWAALALIISAPLHLAFVVAVPVPALAAVSWVLTAIGFGAAGRSLLASPESSR
jgi:hypothetical protein